MINMKENMHHVFVSFHHGNDQGYKDTLVTWAEENDVFIDDSVEMGEIPQDWDAQKIRTYIRDYHLKSSKVTILLVGTETQNRKHVDWELYSSMYDGAVNKKSGIIVIMLPSTECNLHTLPRQSDKETILPEQRKWISIKTFEDYKKRYPDMPDRIIDNLLKSDVNIAVINWSDLTDWMGQLCDEGANKLRQLIENAYNDRASNDYDMTRPMRMHNS